MTTKKKTATKRKKALMGMPTAEDFKRVEDHDHIRGLAGRLLLRTGSIYYGENPDMLDLHKEAGHALAYATALLNRHNYLQGAR